MSDLELNKSDREPDAMDGGFAVVDRERIIEEEITNVTPWYKHFIHVFTAPGQMMEECLGIEPSKGGSIGVVGCILFTVIALLVSFMNPAIKMMTYEALRAQGTAETALAQTYSVAVISGTLGGIIGIFIGALISTILFQIVRVILKDKCKFATMYKMLLLATMVTMAIQCVDAILACLLGMSDSIFSIGIILSEEMKATALGSVLANSFTLQGIIGMAFMALGYKIITHTSIKKGIVAVIIVEIISMIGMYLITSWSLNMQAGLASMAG